MTIIENIANMFKMNILGVALDFGVPDADPTLQPKAD